VTSEETPCRPDAILIRGVTSLRRTGQRQAAGKYSCTESAGPHKHLQPSTARPPKHYHRYHPPPPPNIGPAPRGTRRGSAQTQGIGRWARVVRYKLNARRGALSEWNLSRGPRTGGAIRKQIIAPERQRRLRINCATSATYSYQPHTLVERRAIEGQASQRVSEEIVHGGGVSARSYFYGQHSRRHRPTRTEEWRPTVVFAGSAVREIEQTVDRERDNTSSSPGGAYEHRTERRHGRDDTDDAYYIEANRHPLFSEETSPRPESHGFAEGRSKVKRCKTTSALEHHRQRSSGSPFVDLRPKLDLAAHRPRNTLVGAVDALSQRNVSYDRSVL